MVADADTMIADTNIVVDNADTTAAGAGATAPPTNPPHITTTTTLATVSSGLPFRLATPHDSPAGNSSDSFKRIPEALQSPKGTVS